MIDGLDDLLASTDEPGLPELRAALWDCFGGSGRAARVIELRPLKARVYRLRVAFGADVRSLVLKRLRPPVAWRNQLVVERWLPAIGVAEASPPLRAVAAARAGGHVWHVYDDLGDGTLEACAADPRAVEAAVGVVARLHARSAGYAQLPACRLHGGDRGMAFYVASVRDAIRGLEALGSSCCDLRAQDTAQCDRLLAILQRRLEEQPQRVCAMAALGGPEVLLHGDLWPSNVLLCPAEDGPHACLIDWDHAGVGPISYDLSTLLSRFPPADRRPILDLYRASLGRDGWRLPSDADLDPLFATAQWARWATCVTWAALAAAEGCARWALDELAEIERWCEMMSPLLPHE